MNINYTVLVTGHDIDNEVKFQLEVSALGLEVLNNMLSNDLKDMIEQELMQEYKNILIEEKKHLKLVC